MIPLFITVDTEGDNGWDRPKIIRTTNARGITRFQDLCEKYGIKPIYLTTYEMALDDILVSSLKRKNFQGLCEIGMHMHSWTTPPIVPLTGDDLENLPFITEFSHDIICEKVKTITTTLENHFEDEIVSHRSGRWIVDEDYLQILIEHGYKVDCSYTPLINWKCSKGNPNGDGGVDYSIACSNPNLIRVPKGEILEIPMTTMSNCFYDNIFVRGFIKVFSNSKKMNKICNALNGRKVSMLRPDRRREKTQLNIIEKLKDNKDIQHVELMIHSSEVYQGTSPHSKTEEDIEELYRIMDKMFADLCSFCEPMTFKEYISRKKGCEL